MLSLMTIIYDLYINPTLTESVSKVGEAEFVKSPVLASELADLSCGSVRAGVGLTDLQSNSLSFAKVLIAHPDLERRWSIGNEPWLPWRGKRLPNTCAISVALPTKVIGPSKSIAFCCMPLGLF